MDGGRIYPQDPSESKIVQHHGDNEDQQKQQKQLYEQWMAMNGSFPGTNNGTYGFDGMNGGFASMGFNNPADFSQMMQFMPNGMQNNVMGAFPNMMSESHAQELRLPLLTRANSNAGNGLRPDDHGPGYDEWL